MHTNNKDVPLDADGYPVVSFWAEDGSYKMTKAENEAYDAEMARIGGGGDINLSEKNRMSLNHYGLGNRTLKRGIK